MKKAVASAAIAAVAMLFFSSCNNQNSPVGISPGVEQKTTANVQGKFIGAVQSSTYSDAVAWRAIDGYTDGIYGHGHVSHTQENTEAWWYGILDFWYVIDSVVIYNRTDCCGERLTNFVIQVTMDAQQKTTDNIIWRDELYDNGVPFVKFSFRAERSKSYLFLGMKPVGNGIRIKLNGTNYLSLAEVKVYGTKAVPHGALSFTDDVNNLIVLTKNGYVFSQPFPYSSSDRPNYPYPVDRTSTSATAIAFINPPNFYALDGGTLYGRQYQSNLPWVKYPGPTSFKKLRSGGGACELLGTNSKAYEFNNGSGFSNLFEGKFVTNIDKGVSYYYYISYTDGKVYCRFGKDGKDYQVSFNATAKQVSSDNGEDGCIFIADNKNNIWMRRYDDGSFTIWRSNIKVYDMMVVREQWFCILTDPIVDGGYSVKVTKCYENEPWKDYPLFYY